MPTRPGICLSVIVSFVLLGTLACSSPTPPDVSPSEPAPLETQGATPTGGMWDRLLTPEEFPLSGWSQTDSDSGETFSPTAEPCGLELDALLGEPEVGGDTAAVRAWARADIPEPVTRISTRVVESPGVETAVEAAGAAVAACELGVASQSQLGMLTLTPTEVRVTAADVGFCASYELEHPQLGALVGLTCHASTGDRRAVISLLTPASRPVADADLQSVVDLAVQKALAS